MSIAALVTTYNRPEALARSLPQIAALGWPVLVVDDGTEAEAKINNRRIAFAAGGSLLWLPENRGLAAVLNVGLAYLLADPDVSVVSVFQDDVDVAPDCAEVLTKLGQRSGHLGDLRPYPLITGHDAAEHIAERRWIAEDIGREVTLKTNCRATHLHATRDYWLSVMPIPTRKLHAPCREPGEPRGTGSNVDWWIVRDAPNSIVKRGGYVLCIPGLVRTFLWRKEDSSWDNEQRAGADPEFA